MASIARIPLMFGSNDPWAEVVRTAVAWGRTCKVEWRDAIVVAPFAQHLPLARRAWAMSGVWMPRIETTRTLAARLGPSARPEASQIRFDAALDRLAARRLLRSQSWAGAWAANDRRGFDHAVSALVTTAHALARAAAAVAPERRPAHWAHARGLLATPAGPGATERLLARVALEWAAAGSAPVTDPLFGLRPSAWIIVQAGGPDPLAMNVLASASEGTPCLVVDSDADIADPYATVGIGTLIGVAVCADFEDEAQRAATQVLADLGAGAQPVALIAQDRLLTRRIRALLARQDVPVQDETGWKLSTTRAAAGVASLLRAARRDSDCDEWLDWLKGCAADWPGLAGSEHACQALEAALRRHGWGHPASVDASRLGPGSARLWQAASDLVERFRSIRPQGLHAWLATTALALERCGAMRLLRADDAGRQVLAALHMHGAVDPADAVGDDPITLDDFSAWVDGALEDGTFLPEAPAAAPVVVMPLERAMLRPFGAVVLASADERRLGAAPSPQPLLGETLAAELGVPGVALRRDRETLAFAQILRAPKVSLLRRLDDGGEALAPSPLLERLELARARRGLAGLAPIPDATEARLVEPAPVPRPMPSAGALLPERLSASACAALRTCPYRFYALRLLGLREADELDDEVEKRDYGSWLHAVLLRFHASRGEPLPAADEEARLHAIAREVQQEMHLDEAAFLPFGATFARVAPRYVEWLHARDASGAHWIDGELELTARPVAWAGIEMHGIIDRVDSVVDEAGPVTQLIDYKTGSAEALRNLVRQPQEDTQLAFYAALMVAQSDAGGRVGAIYLPLDERDRIKAVEHVDVETTAAQLVAGIGDELARVRAGAALPALGEGQACEYCAARGLCRRDHWPVEEAAR